MTFKDFLRFTRQTAVDSIRVYFAPLKSPIFWILVFILATILTLMQMQDII